MNSANKPRVVRSGQTLRAHLVKLLLVAVWVFTTTLALASTDSVHVQVLAEETDTPLQGLAVRITIVPTGQVLEQSSNEQGHAMFTVPASTNFTLDVHGIQITGPSSGQFITPADRGLPAIVVALSKKDLAQADEYRRRNEAQRVALETLRKKVDRADVYRTVRGFLDTLFKEEVLSGDTILFTIGKTGVVVPLVADSEGYVYFKGYNVGMQPGDAYSVTCSRTSSIRGGSLNGCSSKDFVFKGEAVPSDWDGGFSYMIIPVGANRLLGLQFQHNSTNFSTNPSLERELSVLARLIMSRGYMVEVQGHTDNVSSQKDSIKAVQANLALSQKRADAVRKYLLEKYKVAPDRITAVGYGEEFPVADNATDEGRALNRRVMIKVRQKQN